LYANESLYEQAEKSSVASPSVSVEDMPSKVITVTKAEEILPAIQKSKEIAFVFDGKRRIYCGEEYELTDQVDLMSVGMSETDFAEILRAIFEDKEKKVFLFKAKETMHFLERYGVKIRSAFEDLSLLRYLVDFTGREEELGFVLDSYGYSKEYPAYSLYRLCGALHEKLTENGMDSLYYDIELPLCEVLYHAEHSGVRVNEALLQELGADYKQKLGAISAKIYEKAGETPQSLNLNSSPQLGKVLFEKLGLPKGKKSKNGTYSVSVEVLENLADDYDIVRDILEYRQVQKLNSTYVEGLKGFICNEKVHTTYTQTVTATGRLSSKNPNLQNIPVRTEMGRELRKLFIADDGCVLIDADYSQIELRLMAHLSGCKDLIAAFQEGQDIHRDTAAKVYGVSPIEVTDDMRRKAKAVNFGLIYGESAFGLAKSLKIKQSEAADFIERYFKAYPEIKEYQAKTVEFARQNGYATTIFGRKREFPELKSNNYAVRQFGERAAMNMPLQGTSADIIKLAMLSVYRRLQEKNMKTKLILQVHDELVLESPEEEAEEAASLLKDCMEHVVELSVPLTVEVGASRSWYDAK
jgi:DNA polymerase-1